MAGSAAPVLVCVAAGLACFWWFAALVFQAKFGLSVVEYTETPQITESTTSAANVLRGTGNWLGYLNLGSPWVPASWTLGTNPAVIPRDGWARRSWTGRHDRGALRRAPVRRRRVRLWGSRGRSRLHRRGRRRVRATSRSSSSPGRSRRSATSTSSSRCCSERQRSVSLNSRRCSRGTPRPAPVEAPWMRPRRRTIDTPPRRHARQPAVSPARRPRADRGRAHRRAAVAAR